MKRLIETILSTIQRRDACFDIYPYYGVAPHKHVMSYAGKIAVTLAIPKEKWPDNFVEDHDCEGLGIYYCQDKKCLAGVPWYCCSIHCRLFKEGEAVEAPKGCGGSKENAPLQ